MASPSGVTPPHDPLAAKLSAADDRILLNHWLPPQEGIVPRVRVGRRWVSMLWALPLAFAVLILAHRFGAGPAGDPSRQGVRGATTPASPRPRRRWIPASRGGSARSTS